MNSDVVPLAMRIMDDSSTLDEQRKFADRWMRGVDSNVAASLQRCEDVAASADVRITGSDETRPEHLAPLARPCAGRLLPRTRSTARVFTVGIEELRAAVVNHMPRPLTDAEWRRHGERSSEL